MWPKIIVIDRNNDWWWTSNMPHFKHTIQRKMSDCDLVRVNEIVMYWQKWKVPRGRKSHWACSLVRNKFQVLRSKCSRVLLTPPCRSYPGTFATFSPAHSGGNGASWPRLCALLSTLEIIQEKQAETHLNPHRWHPSILRHQQLGPDFAGGNYGHRWTQIKRDPNYIQKDSRMYCYSSVQNNCSVFQIIINLKNVLIHTLGTLHTFQMKKCGKMHFIENRWKAVQI